MQYITKFLHRVQIVLIYGVVSKDRLCVHVTDMTKLDLTYHLECF
jgi:hypothetical protein